jgi:hypothetical protein
MQSFRAGLITRSLFPIFEPTRDSSRSQLASQILGSACDGVGGREDSLHQNSRDGVSEVGPARNLCRKKLAKKNHCVTRMICV